MNHELGIRHYDWKAKILFFNFIILYSLFLIPPTASAATTRLPQTPLNSLCFLQNECENMDGIYRGNAVEAGECNNQETIWVEAGYKYNCYAAQPTVPLQVSIGGRTVTGIENYIQRLYNYLLGIVGIVAGIMIVWAGVKWLTAGALPERIEDAKKKIAGALMGLILALASYVILQTVNPALVNLRLPPIKLIRQATISGFCPDDGVWRGQFACGDATTVPGIGQCIGQHCATAQNKCGAWIEPGQDELSYRCMSEELCPDRCDLINDSRFGGLTFAYCLSSVCAQKIPGRCRIHSGQCSPRIGEGSWGCETNSDCAPGLFCNDAELPNTCRRPGTTPADVSCDNDADCQRFLGTDFACNTEYLRDQCVRLGSLPTCEECDRHELCESGRCGTDGECAATTGPYSTDTDRDGEYCDDIGEID